MRLSSFSTSIVVAVFLIFQGHFEAAQGFTVPKSTKTTTTTMTTTSRRIIGVTKAQWAPPKTRLFSTVDSSRAMDPTTTTTRGDKGETPAAVPTAPVATTSLDPTTTFKLKNSWTLLALLLGAMYCTLHEDLHQLAALPTNVNHYKAAMTMLQKLPTEWLAWYDEEALTNPILTKASTSGVCYFLGDLCAQSLVLFHKNKQDEAQVQEQQVVVEDDILDSLELDRAVKSGLAGFIGHGPVAHYWLSFLDSNPILNHAGGHGSPTTVLLKIAIDQGPMSIVYNTIYSFLLGLFAQKHPREILNQIQRAFLPGFLASIQFWPLVHMVTFTVIPVELQLLWIDVMEIIWVCILSQVNNEGLKEQAQQQQQQQQINSIDNEVSVQEGAQA